jgi:hypothetical protein
VIGCDVRRKRRREEEKKRRREREERRDVVTVCVWFWLYSNGIVPIRPYRF